MTTHAVNDQISINATPGEVWQALTEPDLIARYLFGTHTYSDWKAGSEIRFEGEFNGTAYRDKGVIQKIEPEHVLQYTYFSSFSGLEDKAENYQLVTFELEAQKDHTLLHLKQENIASEQSLEHSKNSWKIVLEKMKEVIEQ